MIAYKDFLTRKSQFGIEAGFEPTYMPECLKPFQAHLCDWAIRKGRAGIFAGCGLGKTLMEFVFCENVIRKTGKPALIATPLAVAQQHKREAEKFGIECHVSRDGTIGPRTNVTNYELAGSSSR